jgi:hypothetical protein
VGVLKKQIGSYCTLTPKFMQVSENTLKMNMDIRGHLKGFYIEYYGYLDRLIEVVEKPLWTLYWRSGRPPGTY